MSDNLQILVLCLFLAFLILIGVAWQIEDLKAYDLGYKEYNRYGRLVWVTNKGESLRFKVPACMKLMGVNPINKTTSFNKCFSVNNFIV